MDTIAEGDHIQHPDQLSLTADPTALSGRSLEPHGVVIGGVWSLCNSTCQCLCNGVVVDKRWQELAWSRRGRSEASKRLTVSTFRPLDWPFRDGRESVPSLGTGPMPVTVRSQLGPVRTPIRDPILDPLLGPPPDPPPDPPPGGPPRGAPPGGRGARGGGPARGPPRAPGGEISPPRARGQIWPFPVKNGIILYYWDPPWGPPLGRPPGGAAQRGGQKSAHFFGYLITLPVGTI